MLVYSLFREVPLHSLGPMCVLHFCVSICFVRTYQNMYEYVCVYLNLNLNDSLLQSQMTITQRRGC